MHYKNFREEDLHSVSQSTARAYARAGDPTREHLLLVTRYEKRFITSVILVELYEPSFSPTPAAGPSSIVDALASWVCEHAELRGFAWLAIFHADHTRSVHPAFASGSPLVLLSVAHCSAAVLMRRLAPAERCPGRPPCRVTAVTAAQPLRFARFRPLTRPLARPLAWQL